MRTCRGRCWLPMKEQDTKNPLWHHKIFSYCPSNGAVGEWPVQGSSRVQQQLQGPAAAPGFASFPLQERWRRLCSTPKLHLGEEVRKKQSQRVRQPSGIPLHGFGILPRSPAAFCRRAGPQQPPGLSPPARPDNGRVLGGFGRFTSYKMFVNRIYPVARR